MIRRRLKDLELKYLTADMINAMQGGDSYDVCVVSPIRTNPLTYGYNGSSIVSTNCSTEINTECLEKVYIESKRNSQTYLGHIKCYSNINTSGSIQTSTTKYLCFNKITEITSNPTANVRGCLLMSRGTGTSNTRYMGANGTTVMTTTDQQTAELDPRYHWTLALGSDDDTYYVYNDHEKVWLRYSGGSFTLNATNKTALTVAHATNGFSFKSGNYSMYLNSNTATSITRYNGTRYWRIYSTEVSYIRNSSGTSTWTTPINQTFAKGNPSTTTNYCAGYNPDAFVTIRGASVSTSYYMRHNNTTSSTSNSWSYGTGATNYQASWYIFDSSELKEVTKGDQPSPFMPDVYREPEAGDIMVDWEGELYGVAEDEWDPQFGAEGVCVVPRNVLPDGKGRMISLTYVGSDGSASTANGSSGTGSMAFSSSSSNNTGNYCYEYVNTTTNNRTNTISSTQVTTGTENAVPMGLQTTPQSDAATCYVDNNLQYFGGGKNYMVPVLINRATVNEDATKTVNNHIPALSDFDGKGHTANMTSTTYPMARACTLYSTENTEAGEWYLPSIGELACYATNNDLIQSSLVTAGGIKLWDTTTWGIIGSSTEYMESTTGRSTGTSTQYFGFYSYSGVVLLYAKTVTHLIRAYRQF